ncbi:MAG: PIG-L family deacetylase [Chloroflexi bacterium]|nr:MAG: PIG-L family deacetylase [Chloroflexota bacterium]
MAKKKTQRKAAPRATSRSNSHDPKFARVLGVFAHPDDPEFGAGGSMAKLAKDGANVSKREQRAAAKVLGIKKVEFLGYKDGHLAPDLKLRRDIVRMIRKHKPELVITHIPGRVLDAPMGGSHPDHIAVGEATMAAVYPDSRNPRAFRGLLKEGYQPHVVNEVWIPYWTLGDYFVDISKTLELKLAALKKHKSQVAKPGQEWDVDKWVRKRHRDIGKKGGYQYAESFKRIKV